MGGYMLLSRFAIVALAGCVIATAAFAGDPTNSQANGAGTFKVAKETLIAQGVDDGRYVEACNKSSESISVATATSARETNSKGEDLFLSKGWFNLGPGECLKLWDSPLANRWYYVYAESSRSTWAGTYPFCVSDQKFTIKDTQCGQGYKRRYFTRIDMNDHPGQSERYSFTD